MLSSIILVASDRVFSLTLSGVPALCVKAFAPHSSHTIFEVIIIKSQPQPERFSWATHYVIYSKTFTSTFGTSLDRWWCASLYPKHLDPNRVQEYLKCFRDIAIMKGLNEGLIRLSIPNKPLLQEWFFHICTNPNLSPLNTQHLSQFLCKSNSQHAQFIKHVSSIAPAPIHREIVSVVFNALRER